VVGFAGWFIWDRNKEDPAKDSTSSVQEKNDNKVAEVPAEETASAPELAVDETEDYSLTIPAGFERVEGRIFTFTGEPERTYTYRNSATNDYFEVNVTPAASGLNADFVWTYVYTEGAFTVDKTNMTVCMPEDAEWCEFSGGNGRLDSAIFSEPEAPIDGNIFYFTFGNTASEEVGDLSFVDQFLEGIVF
jgi:hypothetical protein